MNKSLTETVTEAIRKRSMTARELASHLDISVQSVGSALAKARNQRLIRKTGNRPSIYVAVVEVKHVADPNYIPISTVEHAKKHVPASVFHLGALS